MVKETYVVNIQRGMDTRFLHLRHLSENTTTC